MLSTSGSSSAVSAELAGSSSTLSAELAALLKLINWSFSILGKGLVPPTMERNFCYGIYFCCAYICKYAEIQHPQWLAREIPHLRGAFRQHSILITKHELTLPFMKIILDAEEAVRPMAFVFSTSAYLLRGTISFLSLGSEVAYDIVATNRKERSLELLQQQYAPTLFAAMINLHDAFHQYVEDQNRLLDAMEHNRFAVLGASEKTSSALFRLKNKTGKTEEERALLEMIAHDEEDKDFHGELPMSMSRIPSVPNLFKDEDGILHPARDIRENYRYNL